MDTALHLRETDDLDFLLQVVIDFLRTKSVVVNVNLCVFVLALQKRI